MQEAPTYPPLPTASWSWVYSASPGWSSPGVPSCLSRGTQRLHPRFRGDLYRAHLLIAQPAGRQLQSRPSRLLPVLPSALGARSKAAAARQNASPHRALPVPCPPVPLIRSLTRTCMRLLGDGSHGTGDRIQTLHCQACRTTFSARRNTPLYRLKTPASRVGEVLTALCEGLDVAAAGRVCGSHPKTITAWLTRAGKQSTRLHHGPLQHLTFAHLHLDAPTHPPAPPEACPLAVAGDRSPQ